MYRSCWCDLYFVSLHTIVQAHKRNYTYPRYMRGYCMTGMLKSGGLQEILLTVVTMIWGDFLHRTITVQLPEFGNGTTSVRTVSLSGWPDELWTHWVWPLINYICWLNFSCVVILDTGRVPREIRREGKEWELCHHQPSLQALWCTVGACIGSEQHWCHD